MDKDPLSWEALTEAAAQKTKELVEQSAKESAKADMEKDERLNILIRSAEKLQETSEIERR